MMFEHGMARAGYIEVPRDPDLAFEFLQPSGARSSTTGWRSAGAATTGPPWTPTATATSPYRGRVKGGWPIQVDPDDVTRVYFRDPDERRWHSLDWEHAPSLGMPLSDEALAVRPPAGRRALPLSRRPARRR